VRNSRAAVGDDITASRAGIEEEKGPGADEGVLSWCEGGSRPELPC
jgi:hypothetical protein